MLTLDHIVIAAASLAEGREELEARLGQPPSGGGAHPTMGTHNALWRLGDAYLELVAIDPAAPHPGRPRWFGLDDPALQARLAHGPALVGWVLGTADLTAALARAPVRPGEPERHHRGDLHWQLTVPASGTSPGGGTLPLLIRWPDGIRTPPDLLPDTGLRLASFLVRSPLAPAIRAMDPPPPVTVSDGPPTLFARISRPDDLFADFSGGG